MQSVPTSSRLVAVRSSRQLAVAGLAALLWLAAPSVLGAEDDDATGGASNAAQEGGQNAEPASAPTGAVEPTDEVAPTAEVAPTGRAPWAFAPGENVETTCFAALNKSLPAAACDQAIDYVSSSADTRAPQALVGAYTNRALLRLREEDFAGAESDLDAALNLAPTNARAYLNLGNVYLRQRRWAEALAHYDRALELGGAAFAGAHFNRALANRALGRVDAAREDTLAGLTAIAPRPELEQDAPRQAQPGDIPAAPAVPPR